MNYASLISKLEVLPQVKQMEVLDFVDYLASKFAQPASPKANAWTEPEFAALSMAQAMRGLEDEPVLYTAADIKDQWQ